MRMYWTNKTTQYNNLNKHQTRLLYFFKATPHRNQTYLAARCVDCPSQGGSRVSGFPSGGDACWRFPSGGDVCWISRQRGDAAGSQWMVRLWWVPLQLAAVWVPLERHGISAHGAVVLCSSSRCSRLCPLLAYVTATLISILRMAMCVWFFFRVVLGSFLCSRKKIQYVSVCSSKKILRVLISPRQRKVPCVLCMDLCERGSRFLPL